VFDEVYILFHFNIILKHNGMLSNKIKKKVIYRQSKHKSSDVQLVASHHADFSDSLWKWVLTPYHNMATEISRL